MAKSSNPYKDLSILRAKVPGAVAALGATSYTYEKVGTPFHMQFVLDGEAVRIAVYENRGGSTTFSNLGTSSEIYVKVLEAIKAECEAGDGSRVELTVERFGGDNFGNLISFLESEGGKVVNDAKSESSHQVRLQSPQGDTLTLTLHRTDTLQIQGRRTMLVVWTLDFLSNVLNLELTVKAHADAFNVTVKTGEVVEELARRLPKSYKRINEVVRTQLSTALTLLRIDIQLPDYAPIAFPALRGLEGFIKAELASSGLNPDSANNFGEYFDKKAWETSYVMKELPFEKVQEPKATELCGAYTLYSAQRHLLAHVGTHVHNTRILGTLAEARDIISIVIDKIEEFCSKIKQ